MRHSVAPFRIRTAAGRGARIAIFAALAGCSAPLVKSVLTSNVVQEDAHNAYLRIPHAEYTAAAKVAGQAGQASRTGQAPVQVRFVMRSTQSMLYFLGELSRDYAENQRLLTIPVRASPAATLFVAKCCEQAPDAAVSVAYRSKYYHVDPVRPADNAGSGEDRSLQTLALVSLVYGLQNHSGEAPGIRNVRVIP